MKKALALFALFAPALYAADLSVQLTQCRSISNDLQRLVCYDKMNTASAAAYAKTTSNADRAISTQTAVVANTVDDFGLERKVQEAKAETSAQNLSLVLQKVETNKQGLMVFTFENGQVWRQTSKDVFQASEGSVYIVERGMLNSFFMNKEGTNRKTRVIREK